tara:strand:- start:191 stop:472 length:282 start_codon:yes stop_codon:yes gene_type:complete
VEVCPQYALAFCPLCAHDADMTYVNHIIEAFGGVRPMAAAIGKEPSTVQSWKVRGSIPDAQKTLIWEKAREQGVTLAPAHFLPFDVAASDDAA